MNNKKTISPVVAMALLLVVAVVAVVGFQGWFQTYSSELFSDIETNSNSAVSGTLKIDQLIGDTLYIINNIEDNLSINELNIGNQNCIITNNLTLGINKLDVSSCIDNVTTSIPDIALITDKQVVQKQVYLKDVKISNNKNTFNCSNSGTVLGPYGNCWLRDLNRFGLVKWENALINCSNLNYEGSNNWVLPTMNELLDLGNNIGWNETNFQNYGFTNYVNEHWSSTEYNTDRAYHINFNDGTNGSFDKILEHYVTCIVRN